MWSNWHAGLEFHWLNLKTHIDAWTTLESLFATPSASRVMQHTKLLNLKAQDFETIEVFLARFK
jgi:hypothetical protein